MSSAEVGIVNNGEPTLVESVVGLLVPILISETVIYPLLTMLTAISLISLVRLAKPVQGFRPLQPYLGFPKVSVDRGFGSQTWHTMAVEGYIPSVTNEQFTPCGTPMPTYVHRILAPDELRNRVVVVGDVHGCLNELKDLLKKVSYEKDKDTVILVGDMVNKGLYSAGVVRFAREEGFYCVRGNHDDAALGAYYGVGRFKSEIPPSYDYVKEFTKEDVEWLNELPYTLSLPSFNATVVHAGLLPGLTLGQQTAATMSRLRSIERNADGQVVGVESIQDDPWAKIWPGPYHIYFGHDAKRGLQLFSHATGLDTGCCYGKELTAVILPEQRIVSVKARQVYTIPGRD